MLTQADIRESITSRIAAALKAGGLPPWRRPWVSRNSGVEWPTNVVSKRRYSGINVLLLHLTTCAANYPTSLWGTFNQWRGLGCQVRKGEHGTQGVFYKPVEKARLNDNGEEEKRSFPLLKTFYLFNLAQVTGEVAEELQSSISETFHVVGPQELLAETHEPAERAIAATGAEIRVGTQALYRRPPADRIECPPKESFLSLPGYYETLFHELIHWSECRLKWKGSYAEGELIAEIGACFLASAVGVPDSNDLTNHNAYLQSWLKEMANDHRFIFRAASQASKAADFILSFSNRSEELDTVVDAIGSDQ